MDHWLLYGSLSNASRASVGHCVFQSLAFLQVSTTSPDGSSSPLPSASLMLAPEMSVSVPLVMLMVHWMPETSFLLFGSPGCGSDFAIVVWVPPLVTDQSL